jgi:hypothetical protein
MSTQTISASVEQAKEASGPKRPLLIRIGAWIMENIISTLFALLAAVFFIWVNGKQHEFDKLEDKPKRD